MPLPIRLASAGRACCLSTTVRERVLLPFLARRYFVLYLAMRCGSIKAFELLYRKTDMDITYLFKGVGKANNRLGN